MIRAFQTIGRIIHGNGASRDFGNEVRAIGASRVLIVTSEGIARAEIRGIAERAAAAKRLMDNNPRQGTAEDLQALLEEHF